jgi:hypothetical protein
MNNAADKRTYTTPALVRFGEVSQLTASGSGGASESAAGPSGMGCDVTFKTNQNCPPGGF